MSSICKPGPLIRTVRMDHTWHSVRWRASCETNDLRLEKRSDDETPWLACLVRDSRLSASGLVGLRSTGRNCIPR
jgi:hypothetical protein